MALNGSSTDVVKLQLESIISYNLTMIKKVGSVAISAPGSATYTAGTDSLAVTGDNIVVRANTNIMSTSDIAVTITGTDSGDAALTGTATIGALVTEGQSYEVTPSVAGHKFKTITSVAVTNGVNGDGFDISVLPDESDDVVIKFDQGFAPDLGNEVKPIYDKYNLDHNKRVRGDHTLTLSAFYTNATTGLPRIHNRDATLRWEFRDDGQATPTEVRYYHRCRLSVKVESPSADDGEVTASGEGTFGDLYVFS